jgi:hypothetical protein
VASVIGAILGAVQLIAGIILTASGAGAGIGLKLILSGGISLISQFMGSKNGRDGWKSSIRYGFDNLTNSVSEGAPIPIVYGEEQVAPRWLSTNLIQEGDSQTLLLLGLLCEGEIESVSDVRFNGAPIASFPGSTYEVRYGTADQTVVKDFNEIGTAYQASTHLSDDDGTGATPKRAEQHIHEMRAQGDAVVLGMTWPGGLFSTDDDGNMTEANIGVRIETKRVADPDTAYAPYSIPLVNGKREQGNWYTDGNAGIWKTKAKTRSSLRRQIRLNFDTRDAYSVRITGTYHDAGNELRIPTLSVVIEILNDARAYPNRALIALRCPASAQLSGMPNVTGVVRGTKVLSGPSYTTYAWTRNPAWCLRDLLLHSRYGFGDYLSSSDVDATTWEATAAENDGAVTPPGKASEALHQLDLEIDTKAPARDWIAHICTVMRASIFQSEGKLKLVRDRVVASSGDFEARRSPVTRSNVLATPGEQGSKSSCVQWSLDEQQRWTGVRLSYMDREQLYTRQTITVTDRRISIGAISNGPLAIGAEIVGQTSHAVGRLCASYVTGEAFVGYVQEANAAEFVSGEVVKQTGSSAQFTTTSAPYDPTPQRWLEIQMPGITRRTAAVREARYYLTTAARRRQFLSWGLGNGDLKYEIGDVVRFSSDWLPYVQKKFQILGTGMERDGRGTIESREYDEDVYAAPFDPIPAYYAFTPGGAGPVVEGLSPRPAPDGSNPPDPSVPPFGTVTPAPPPPAQAPPPATPPPPSSSVSNVTSTSKNPPNATAQAILSAFGGAAKKTTFKSPFGRT